MKNNIIPENFEFDQSYANEQIRRSRQPLRRFIKGFYLQNVLRELEYGPSIDFGCGAGQLLERMHSGSVGIEVNPHLVASLRKAGMTVNQASGEMCDFKLEGFVEGKFRSLVIAHVLEHLPDPAEALRILLLACQRIGVTRVVVVVPGSKGFASDRTHKTFVNRAYIEKLLPAQNNGFVISSLSFFPGPWEWVGRYFIFHEMKVVFDNQASLG